MRKLILTFGLAMTGLSLMATPLTPDQALARMTGASSSPAHAPAVNSSGMRHCSTVMTPDHSAAAVYLFTERAASSTANLAVSTPSILYFLSADDQAEPLLGYIELPAGKEDVKMEDFPPQLQGLLAEYAAQIAAAQKATPTYAQATDSSSEQPVRAQRVTRSAIWPLCSTKWNQGAPFYNMTPTVNGTHCVTGCTATAMAQVMKYWNYPVNGQGTISYNVNGVNENGEKEPLGAGNLPTGTLTLDCSSLNLDWNNMLNTYVSGSYNTTQSNAVAKLMITAGYCAHMGYGTDASAASAYTGIDNMKKYLNYNDKMQGLSRSNFSTLAWEDMLYEHLSKVGPVINDGFGINAAGHAFVCDGYYDGRFHYNWGWGGSYDGWFYTTALMPGGEGIGGNGQGDYSFNQNVYINITKPDHATITPNINIHNLAGNLIGSLSSYEGYLNLTTPRGFFAFNGDSETHKFRYWGKYVAADGTETWATGDYGNLAPGYGYYNVDIRIPDELTDGTYYVYPYYSLDNGSEKIPMGAPNGIVNYCKLTISNNGTSFSVENFSSPELEATNVTAKSAIYLKSPFKLSYKVNNNSVMNLSDGLRPVLYLKNSSSAPAQRATSASDVTIIATGEYRLHDLQAGQNETKEQDTSMSTTYSSVPSGQIYLGMQSLASGNITGETPVRVMNPASGTPTIEDVSFKFDGNASSASNVNMSFSGTVKCTSGYFVGSLRLYIFNTAGTANFGSFTTNTMYLETNQTGYYQATGTFDGAVKGTTYWILPYYQNGTSFKQLGYGVQVTITDVGTEIVDVKATGISLDKTSATLMVDETLQLDATITPSSTTNQEVVWSSSNNAVATVDQNGKVTAVSTGSANITVKTQDGTNLTATCKVNVIKLVSAIELNETEMTMNEGKSAQLTATVLPNDASNKTLSWSSSNPAVATVDQTGKVTAIAKGSATITVTSTDGSNVSATCLVNVNKPVSSIVLNETEMTMNEGTTAQLTATVSDDATVKTLTWSSSNPDVATVDQNGLVTAISVGNTTVTATSTDGSGVSATCDVTVVKFVSSISVSHTTLTLKEGEEATVTANVLPTDATNPTLRWHSEKPEVATVDDGVVKAVSEGSTYVVVSSTDGSNIQQKLPVEVSILAGIGATSSEGLSISVVNGVIRIVNVPTNEFVYIYHADGTMAAKEQSVGQSITYQPAVHGVYLVVVGSQSYKVVI